MNWLLMRKIDRHARNVIASAVAELARRIDESGLGLYARVQVAVIDKLAMRIERESNLRVIVRTMHKLLTEELSPSEWRRFFIVTDYVEAAHFICLYHELM